MLPDMLPPIEPEPLVEPAEPVVVVVVFLLSQEPSSPAPSTIAANTNASFLIRIIWKGWLVHLPTLALADWNQWGKSVTFQDNYLNGKFIIPGSATASGSLLT